MPPIFTWLQRLGEIDDDEMDRVFNMGVGLALVRQPVLRRQHPPPTGRLRRGELADRARGGRAARGDVGINAGCHCWLVQQCSGGLSYVVSATFLRGTSALCIVAGTAGQASSGTQHCWTSQQ